MNEDKVKDLSVPEVLEMWGLAEYAPKFAEEGVDMQLIFSLGDPDCKEQLCALIPRVGHQLKLLSNLKKVVTAHVPVTQIPSKEHAENNTVIEIVQSDKDHVSLETDMDLEFVNSFLSLPGDKNIGGTVKETVPGNRAPSALKKRAPPSTVPEELSAKKPCDGNNNIPADDEITQLLKQSGSGRYILGLARQCPYIKENKDQDKLVELIIDKELGHGGRISTDRFIELSNGILKIFPEESKDTYYIPYKKDAKKQAMLAKGKLVTKYYHLRSDLKSIGELSGSSGTKPQPPLHDRLEEASESLKGRLNFLHTNVEPWDTVVQYWTDTSAHRTHALQMSDGGDVADYLKSYPVLKDKLGYTLLEIDFDSIYEGYQTKIYTELDTFCERAIRAYKAVPVKSSSLKRTLDLLDCDSLTKDAKNLVALLSLADLDQVVTIKRGKKKGETWRPPHAEIQEGFISQISAVGKLGKFINDRRDKLYKYGQKMQPFVVVCGPSVEDIEACYIILDGLQYLVPSYVRALDICFKVFHALHASYPIESYRLWMLIQRELYGMQTKYDRKDSQLPSLLKKFK